MNKREYRKLKIKEAKERLNKNEIEFTCHNNDYHFVVEESIDFWPTSKSGGLWIVKINGRRGYGLRNLIKEIQKYQ